MIVTFTEFAVNPIPAGKIAGSVSAASAEPQMAETVVW
jgi:hypothetical protein